MYRKKMLAFLLALALLFTTGCSSIFSGDTRVILPDQELVLPGVGMNYEDGSLKEKFTVLSDGEFAAFYYDPDYNPTAPVSFELIDYIPEESSFVYAYQLLEKDPKEPPPEKQEPSPTTTPVPVEPTSEPNPDANPDATPQPTPEPPPFQPTKMISSLIKYNYKTQEVQLIFSQVSPPNGEQTMFAQKLNYREAYFLYFNGTAYYYTVDGQCFRAVDLMSDYSVLVDSIFPKRVRETIIDAQNLYVGNGIEQIVLRAVIENEAIDESYELSESEMENDSGTIKDIAICYTMAPAGNLYLHVMNTYGKEISTHYKYLYWGPKSDYTYMAEEDYPKLFNHWTTNSIVKGPGQYLDILMGTDSGTQMALPPTNVNVAKGYTPVRPSWVSKRVCGFVQELVFHEERAPGLYWADWVEGYIKNPYHTEVKMSPDTIMYNSSWGYTTNYFAYTPSGVASYTGESVYFLEQGNTITYKNPVADVGSVNTLWTAVLTKDEIELVQFTYPSKSKVSILIPRENLAVFDKSLMDMQNKAPDIPGATDKKNPEANKAVDDQLAKGDTEYDAAAAEEQITTGEVGSIEEYNAASIIVNSPYDILLLGPQNGILRYSDSTKTTKQLLDLPLYRMWQDPDGNYTAIGFNKVGKTYTTQDILMSRVIRLSLD